ncbi:hypothetical protein HXX76_010448 [Chlamydomonas incerta]|uniref:Uncharacterized protein n=1 Tax=Chlamydomonas incerta TaxID=51695 RepID=A0A835SXG1_CHLIN|nr:hypothetical protein HXX76_010448 [Chlamydomonas incerta]|eukprot:KAG2428300.1 hypothetical protein HXX76_010448 [Chlamydomonas incerta]
MEPASGLSVAHVELQAQAGGTGGPGNVATQAAEFEVTVVIRGTGSGSGSSPVTTQQIRVLVEAAEVKLVSDPEIGALAAVLPPGGSTVLTVEVRNDGNTASGALSLPPIPPDVTWLAVATPFPMPAIPPGGSATLLLLLKAPDNAQLGQVYRVQQLVLGAQAGGAAAGHLPLSVELAVASEPTGSLEVQVVDEYTTYAPGQPRVAGARLLLKGPDGGIIGQGLTNGSGIFTFLNLTAGYTYSLDAFSSNHSTTSRTVAITGGRRQLRVFMARTAVRATFSVVPTTFQETVQLTVNVEYVTFVPMPVIRMEPPLIFWDELGACSLDGTPLTLHVINTGLIAAQNVRLRIPRFPLMYNVDFAGARWLQKENATSNNETASVAFYPPGPTAELAWASAVQADDAAGDAGLPTSSIPRADLYGPDQEFVVLIGRMPAMFSDACDSSKSTVIGQGASIVNRSPCPRVISDPPNVDRGSAPGGGPLNPTYEVSGGGGPEIPSLDICNKCVQGMFVGAACIVENVAPTKEIELLGKFLGAIYNIVSKDLIKTVTIGKLKLPKCFIDMAAECLGMWNAISDAVNSATKSVGSALGAAGNAIGNFGSASPGSWVGASTRGAGSGSSSSGRRRLLMEYVEYGGVPPGRNNTWIALDEQQPLMMPLQRRQALGTGKALPDPDPILLTPAGKAVIRWSAAMLMFNTAAMEMWSLEYYEEWIGSNYPIDLEAEWRAKWEAATATGSAAGLTVDWNEEAPALLGERYEPLASRAARELLIARWNVTFDLNRPDPASFVNQTTGAAPMSGYLPDGSPRPIDLVRVTTAQLAYLNETIAALELGYRGCLDALLEAITALVATHVTAAQSGGGATCARVVIQLSQTLVMTRQAFEASLVLDNEGADPITDIAVELKVWEHESGELAANGTFALGEPLTEDQFQGGSGAWSLSAGASGTLRWLLVPRVAAALSKDTWYTIGGTLWYTPGPGLPPEMVPLEPANVRVSPEGRLDVRYYVEKWVQGDNPFTPEQEPSPPAAFATLLTNVGGGVARGLEMQSLQPKILENEKGLLVAFNITGVAVNGRPQPRALQAAVGDIMPNSSALVVWSLRCSLQGTFSGLNASFTTRNPLNDPTLSAVSRVALYDMLRLVYINGADFDDGLPDMLVTQLDDDARTAALAPPEPAASPPGNSSTATNNTSGGANGTWAAALTAPTSAGSGHRRAAAESIINITTALPLPTQLHSSKDGAVVPLAVVPDAAVLSISATAIDPASDPIAAAAVGGTDRRAVVVEIRVDGWMLLPPRLLPPSATGGLTMTANARNTKWQYLRVRTPEMLKPSSGWSVIRADVTAAASSSNGSSGGGAVTAAAAATQVKLPYNAWSSYRAYVDARRAEDHLHVLHDGFIVGAAENRVRLVLVEGEVDASSLQQQPQPQQLPLPPPPPPQMPSPPPPPHSPPPQPAAATPSAVPPSQPGRDAS